MCLITISYQLNPKYPFILVANRDEFYLRPTAVMQHWQDRPSILAGRDLEQKGTWLGIAKTGRLAALTNYRSGSNTHQVYPSSRGHLVSQALIENYPLQNTTSYAPFNLIYADQEGLRYTNNHQLPAADQILNPGVYGLCNAALDTPWPKLTQAKAEFSKVIAASSIHMDDLKALMSDKQIAAKEELPDTGISEEWESALSSQFIKINDKYGTRAKTIILQDHSGKTRICEMRYDPSGFIGESNFEMDIAVFGQANSQL